MLEYYVDEDKRCVVAVLKIKETGAIYKGKAKCNPSDKFSFDTGATLARVRALRKWKRDEAKEAFAQYQTSLYFAKKAKKYAEAKQSSLANLEKWLNDFLKTV